jgi:hypothetical protein
MLTAHEIALVRLSFARVVPIKATVADLFYDRLFGVAPAVGSCSRRISTSRSASS